MLDVALNFLKDAFNTYLVTRTGSDTVKMTLSTVVDEAGKYAFSKDSICCSILNISEERHLKNQLPNYTTVNGQHVVQEPELKLNLDLLFAAHFTHYDQALKYISALLLFFQAHPIFTSDQYPGLAPQLGRLTVELLPLNYEQLNQLWAFVGAKQLPSVVYRVRLIALQDETPTGFQPPLTTIRTTVQSR